MKCLGLALFLPTFLFTGLAIGQIAEEIRSESWCRQAVELAKQRGEDPSEYGIVCEIDYTKPPQHWQCVVDTMKNQGKHIAAASDHCMETDFYQ